MTTSVSNLRRKLPPWHSHAACAQVYVPAPNGEADPWFPSKGAKGSIVSTEANDVARQVCARCPVRDACLQDALLTRDRFGMRGGLSPHERKGMRPRGRDPAR